MRWCPISEAIFEDTFAVLIFFALDMAAEVASLDLWMLIHPPMIGCCTEKSKQRCPEWECSLFLPWHRAQPNFQSWTQLSLSLGMTH